MLSFLHSLVKYKTSPNRDSFLCGLGHELTEVNDDAVLCPLCERTDAAAGNHEGHWLARCWVYQRLLLQVWHLATLGFDVAVADVSCRQWGLSRDYADLAHKIGRFRMPECYLTLRNLANLSGGQGSTESRGQHTAFLANIRNLFDFSAAFFLYCSVTHDWSLVLRSSFLEFRMELSAVLDRVTALSNDPTDFGRAKYARLLALLAEKELIVGIVERLVVSLKTEAGFTYTNPNLTSERCPTVAEPSLNGSRFEWVLEWHRTAALAKLKGDDRRSATVAEGLLYGLTYPGELSESSWIWCLDQVVVVDGNECLLVLCIDGGELSARLDLVSRGVRAGDRVLSFPMTEAELAKRDAERTERAERTAEDEVFGIT